MGIVSKNLELKTENILENNSGLNYFDHEQKCYANNIYKNYKYGNQIILKRNIYIMVTYTRDKRKEKELIDFYKIVVKALIISLNKKSNYTSQHSENVANYARLLATKFNFKTKKT